MNILSQSYLDEIRSLNKEIVCLVSGGTESTVVAYELYNNDIDCTLLHGDTGLVQSSSYSAIEQLVEDTGFKFERVKAQDYIKRWNWTPGQILVRSFEKFLSTTEQTDLPCRYNLKLNPMKRYSKKNHSNKVFISSIAPYESKYRGIFLRKIREQDTYIHSKWGLNYSYPLRDCYSPKVIPKYLKDNCLNNVENSFCSLCPIHFFKQKQVIKNLQKFTARYTLEKYLSKNSNRYTLDNLLSFTDLKTLTDLLSNSFPIWFFNKGGTRLR